MFEYIQKFNSLPQDIRERVTGTEAMKILEVLEEKYGVELAATVMRVMVKEISVIDLPKFFVFEYNMDGSVSQQLAEEIENKIFSRVTDFLGLGSDKGVSIDEVDINKEKAKIVKNVSDVQGSSFFFSSEDEEEVRKLAKELGGHEEKEAAKLEEIEIKTNAVVDETKVAFSSEILSDRYRNVTKTYLKNIRNRLQTRDTLTKDTNIGGLGLDDIQADRVLKIADKYKQEIHSGKSGETPTSAPPKMKLPEDEIAKQPPVAVSAPIAEKDKMTQSGIRDVDYDFAALKKQAPKTTVVENVPNTSSLKTPSQGKEVKPMAPLNVIRSIQPIGKVKMEDVKRVTKLTGPVDELRNLDLVNFRRLSEDPVRAVDKIMEKLKYLEDDSYAKRIDGIKAWRQSPTNKLYLEIGHASITKHKAIEEILRERVDQGSDFFTMEEFEAIMELNKQMRF